MEADQNDQEPAASKQKLEQRSTQSAACVQENTKCGYAHRFSVLNPSGCCAPCLAK